MQRVAIIGAGWMAGVHGVAYSGISNAELVAIQDIRTDLAEKLAGSLGCTAYTDFEEMLSAAKPDVIDICTPTMAHVECSLRALKAGKHVILEKPMARTLEECRVIVEAAKRSDSLFMVAHVLRFFPEYAKAKALVDVGAVGNAAVVHTTRGGGAPGGWFMNFDLSGGVALDTLVHDYDWLRWLFGDAERVFAKGLVEQRELGMDYALVTIRFKNGVIAHCEGNWAHTTGGFFAKYEIAGDGGLIEYSNKESVPLVIRRTTDQNLREAIPESPMMQDPFYLELKHFIDCIENGIKPIVSPEDGMHAVEIGLAALESIKTGKPVEIGA